MSVEQREVTESGESRGESQVEVFREARDCLRSVENNQTRAENFVVRAGSIIQRAREANYNPTDQDAIDRLARVTSLSNNDGSTYNSLNTLINRLRNDIDSFEITYGSLDPNDFEVGTRQLTQVHNGNLPEDRLNFLRGIVSRGREIAYNIRVIERDLRETDEAVTSLEEEVDIDQMLANGPQVTTTLAETIDADGLDESDWDINEPLDGQEGTVRASSLKVRNYDGARVGRLANGARVELEGLPVKMNLNGKDFLMGRIKGTRSDSVESAKYVALGFLSKVSDNIA